MNFTTDKLKSLVKKWHSLIEAFADVKTTDGYYMRLFCIGFTKKQQNQVRKTSYAQSSQIRQVKSRFSFAHSIRLLVEMMFKAIGHFSLFLLGWI